ncbi:MAG: protein kinase [Anaerolineae bacterium]|nr:protein kinase [Gemmatimonadaceae bacterium]
MIAISGTQPAVPQRTGATNLPAASETPSHSNLSLAWKIFLASAAVIFTVLGGTLLLTTLSARRTADQGVARGLDQTRRLVTVLLEGRERELASGALVFAQGPAFRALVIDKRPEDLLDQGMEAVQQIGASWVQITDAEGVRLAKSDEPTASQDTLAGSVLIGSALEGKVAAGAGIAGDSAIFQAVAVPIPGVTQVAGVLMAALLIDSALAVSIKEATASNIIFFVLDRDGKPRLAASTLGRGPAIAEFLARHEVAKSTEPTAPTKVLGTGDTARSSATGFATRSPMKLSLGDTSYVGNAQPLRSAGGDILGGVIALRSRDLEMAPFVEFRRRIFIAAVLGMALASALSYLLAHRITRPIITLVDATQRVADGDYSAEVTVRTRDEIGTLASAVRTMLMALREKQALVDFLSTSGVATERTNNPPTPRARLSSATPSSSELLPGIMFAGRYEITDLLGAGGAGVVYKAFDQELGEVIAIKTLRTETMSEDPAALERLKSEIRLARRISHRNVVRTHDFGEAEGVYFLTMEFVAGTPLDQLIARTGRIPVAGTLSIATQICRALEVAHEQGIIHRDIKPQNLMVQPDGVLKVMDFGLARLERRTEGLTRVGMVVGTLAYMSPEQLLDENVDARADLYAAGVVLYECLTGRRPLEADSPAVFIGKLLADTPPSPRELNGEVPAALSDLIMRTIAGDRNLRPGSAAELRKQLTRSEA